MCVAVPGKILALDEGDLATVDFGGTTREVSVAFLEEPSIGDYVIVHAGFALHKVEPEAARETLEMMRQIFNDPDRS